MSQTADADHAHFFTRPGLPVRSGEYVVIPAHNKGATAASSLAGDEYAEHIAHERRSVVSASQSMARFIRCRRVIGSGHVSQ